MEFGGQMSTVCNDFEAIVRFHPSFHTLSSDGFFPLTSVSKLKPLFLTTSPLARKTEAHELGTILRSTLTFLAPVSMKSVIRENCDLIGESNA